MSASVLTLFTETTLDGFPLWVVLLICGGVFLAGFMDAIAGGGGIISVPVYLMAFSGLPTHFVLGTNKLSSCIGTAFSTARFIHQGYVHWRLFLPAAGLALCAAADQRIAPPWRVLCGAAALAGCAALAAHSFSVLRRRGAPVPMLFTCAVWLVLAVGGALALRYACVSAARLGRLRFACFWGTVYFIVELAVIGLLKLVWARTRFDECWPRAIFPALPAGCGPLGRAAPAFHPATPPRPAAFSPC